MYQCRPCAGWFSLCELIYTLLCWFRVLCSLVIFPSPLSLIICLPSLSKSSAGFDEDLQFRFSFCIMPACQSLNLFPSAARGCLSDDESLKHWSMHIEKYQQESFYWFFLSFRLVVFHFKCFASWTLVIGYSNNTRYGLFLVEQSLGHIIHWHWLLTLTCDCCPSQFCR